MAVISVREHWEGRDSDSEFGKESSHNRTFKVVTDNKYDTGPIVANDPRIPAPYTPHPNDPRCYVKKIKVKQDRESAFRWTVTVEYSTDAEKEEDKKDENPLARPAEVDWGGSKLQKVGQQAYRVINGQAQSRVVGYLSSSDEPFDPAPEVKGSNIVLSIVKNVPTGQKAWFKYINAVNSDSVTIDGLSFAPGTLQCNDVKVGKFTKENGVRYRVATFEVEENEDGWDIDLLDQGFSTISRFAGGDDVHRPILDATGQPVSKPVLLNGNGQKLPKNGEHVFLTYRPVEYRRLPFSQLPLQ